MASSVLDVPELVDMFAAFLEPTDLVSCLQVCSTWHLAFAPTIWRNFDDSTGMWNNEILRKSSQGRDQDWVNGVFGRYGHLIRHGTFSWLRSMQAARDHCHDLVSLDLRPGSRITEVQADFIHDQRREVQRLQHMERDRKRVKMQTALAIHVLAGHPAYTFRWNNITETVEDPPSFGQPVAQVVQINVEASAGASPVPITIAPIPVPPYNKPEIWHPTNGKVEDQEILACIDLLGTNNGLQKLTTARFDWVPKLLQQNLESALSSMPHLAEAQITLDAGQIARLADFLPRAEILNVKQQTGYMLYNGFWGSVEPFRGFVVDKDSTMTKMHSHLRSLVLGDQLTSIHQIGALLDHCPRLETLSVSSFAFFTAESSVENAPPPPPQSLPFGFFTMPQTVTLPPPHPDRPIFAEAFKTHMALKHLEISDNSNADWLGALLERFPHLESLGMIGLFNRPPSRPDFDAGRYFIVRSTKDRRLDHPVHQHLKSLTLRCLVDMEHLIQDLRRCKALEHFVVSSCSLQRSLLGADIEAHSQQDNLPSALSNLRSLSADVYVSFSATEEQTGLNYDSDRAMMALFKLMPNLESLKSASLGPLSAEAISMFFSTSLTVVDLDEALVRLERDTFGLDDQEQSQVVSKILSSCPKLEVFFGLEYTIHVGQIVQHPWVCRNLKKLRTQIVGVPRLTQDQYSKIMNRLIGREALLEPNEEEQVILDQYERCRNLQHAAFDQLSRMTELTHLDLGFENRESVEFSDGDTYEEDGVEYAQYPGPFPDTLELTLEAGFGRLATLNKLELFGFESVDHRMEMQECQWMAENWPNLKLMYGLAKVLLHRDKPDHHGNAMRAWMQTVRPDIEHTTLCDYH